MIQRVKKSLLHLVGAIAILATMTACGIRIEQPNNGPKEEDIRLTRCWRLDTFCKAPADVDVYIDLDKEGNFTICQRTEELTYTVFNGYYTVDEENSVLSGIYSDGTPWTDDYAYVLDKEKRSLTLTGVTRTSEVSVYKPAEMPDMSIYTTSRAAENDVKPL